MEELRDNIEGLIDKLDGMNDEAGLDELLELLRETQQEVGEVLVLVEEHNAQTFQKREGGE